MIRNQLLLVLLSMFFISNLAVAQGGCSTTLESIENASLEELGNDYRRLLSYKNPYCDTTGSDLELMMKQLESLLKTNKASKEEVIKTMGEPYYHGPLAEYENQKLTIGRDGKPMGKSLPPSYKIPTGEYFIVYLWRKKDYLVFALKGNQVSETKWWEKGDFR